ncbi:hypothetical protein MRX96_002804 [Rhipicephalus microplus]
MKARQLLERLRPTSIAATLSEFDEPKHGKRQIRDSGAEALKGNAGMGAHCDALPLVASRQGEKKTTP